MANERLFKVYNPETRELRDATYDQAVRLKAAGFKTGEDAERAFYADGPAGLITAAVTGGAGGASLGVTDVLKEYLPDSAKRYINASEEAHPYAHGAGELAGGIAGLGKLNALGRAAGMGVKALAASNVAASAVQGGLQAWSNDARQNDGFNVEHVASGAGYGSLWGIGGELGGRVLSKLHGLAQGPANWLSDKAKSWKFVELNEAGTRKRAIETLAEQARKAEEAGMPVPQANVSKAVVPNPEDAFAAMPEFPTRGTRKQKQTWFEDRKADLQVLPQFRQGATLDAKEAARRNAVRDLESTRFVDTPEGRVNEDITRLRAAGADYAPEDLGVENWRNTQAKPHFGTLITPEEEQLFAQDNPFSKQSAAAYKASVNAVDKHAKRAAQQAMQDSVTADLGPVYKASRPGTLSNVLGSLVLSGAAGGLAAGALHKAGYDDLAKTVGAGSAALVGLQSVKYRYGLGRQLLAELASKDVTRNRWFESAIAPSMERAGAHLNMFLRSTGSVTAFKPMSPREIDRAYATISDGAQRLSDNPQAIDEHYQAQLGPLTQDNPQMHGQLVTKAGQVVQAVKATIPQNPLPTSALNPTYDPPRSVKLKTVQMYQALNNPVQTLLTNPTPDQQTAIKRVYPEISKDLNEQLLTAVQDGTIKKWPRAKQAQLSRLMGGPMRPSDNAQYIARAQAAIAANNAQQADSGGQGSPGVRPLSSTVAKNSAKLVAPGTQQNQLEDAL